MKKNTWILFDLDGTLTQSEEGIWKCARHTLKAMGYPEPDEDPYTCRKRQRTCIRDTRMSRGMPPAKSNLTENSS